MIIIGAFCLDPYNYHRLNRNFSDSDMMAARRLIEIECHNHTYATVQVNKSVYLIVRKLVPPEIMMAIAQTV